MAIQGVNKTELTRLLGIQGDYGGVFNETDTYIIDGLFYNYVAASNSMVQVDPLGQFPMVFDPTGNEVPAQGFNPALVNFNRFTGGITYKDDQYTQASPFTATANQWVTVPNNAAEIRDDQFPDDLQSGFYDPVTKKVSGEVGDVIAVVTELAMKPVSVNANYWVDTGFFVGGGLGLLGDGRIWQGTFTFPKGEGEARVHNHTTIIEVSQFVANNGGEFEIRPNHTLQVWGVSYSFYRIHKARG